MMGESLFAIIAFVLFVIATVLAWGSKAHADAFAFAGLAALALAVLFSWAPWNRSHA
jgi:hypothetical protein